MPPQAPRNNLPPEVVRILSFHGLVEVMVGDGDSPVTGRASTAPFEDLVYVLLQAGSPADDALLGSCRLAIAARHPDGNYSLRLAGRACAGLPLPRHPLRSTLEAWVPEGVRESSLTVVPLAAETIELTRTEAEDKIRYHGPTPLGRKPVRPWTPWIHAGFGGLAAPFAIAAVATPFGWLIAQGPDYPWRPVALALSIVAGLSAVAGTRLLTLSLGFARWRKGHARESDAPVLTEGLLAPDRVRLTGLVLLAIWALLVAVIAIGWGDTLFWIAALANGGWLFGPAVTAHLLARQPE